ncbi:MAG: hypothetical protein QM755_09825 [Luteolibacter sp.]
MSTDSAQGRAPIPGTHAWTAAQNFRLGSQATQDNMTWGVTAPSCTPTVKINVVEFNPDPCSCPPGTACPDVVCPELPVSGLHFERVRKVGFCDVAIAAADVTLMREGLAMVPLSLKLARATVRSMRQNLFWALIYNAVSIPVAALGLLNPVLASAAMSLSSVSVLTNSLRLARRKLA